MDEVRGNGMVRGTFTAPIEPPMPMPPEHFHEIRIERAYNGFIVRVGCKTFVTKSWEEVVEGLTLYYTNPHDATEKYLSIK